MAKYTKKLVEGICQDLKNHVGRTDAAKNAGISYKTFRDWYNNKPRFKEAIEEAEEEYRLSTKTMAKQSIVTFFSQSWQAAAWWLERNFPDEFGKRDKVYQEVTGKDGGPIQQTTYNLSELSKEEIRELRRKMKKIEKNNE